MPPLIDERGLIGIMFPRSVDAAGSDAMQRLLIPTCVCSIAVKLIFHVMLFDLRLRGIGILYWSYLYVYVISSTR